jgi:hypothetical protein
MNMARVSRDVFARTELHRELVEAAGTCWWCGGTRGEGRVRKLYKYRTEHDGGRRSEHDGLFCSRSCFDSYHCI